MGRIGVIGLGQMGSAVCRRLMACIQADFTVFDRRRDATDPFVQAGASRAASPRDVAKSCDVVILLVPRPQDVEDVINGDDGLIHGAHAGLTLLQMSTIDRETVVRVHDSLKPTGVRVIDAPVARSTRDAEKGTLLILVAGQPEEIDAVRQLLDCLAEVVVFCGPVGAATTVKLLNNMLGSVTLALTAEVFALAKKADISPNLLLEVLGHTAAGNGHLNASLRQHVLARNFDPGFKIALQVKDLQLVDRLAAQLGAAIPITTVGTVLYQSALLKGYGDQDMSAVVRVLEELDGVIIE